jgi:hypothetical protein
MSTFGNFTVTRASTKNVLGSNGLLQSVANNVPTFEFNTNGSYRGLLVEQGATNLYTYSEQFDDAVWIKSNTTVSANATTAPDGATTADKIVATAVNASHNVAQQPGALTGANVLSVFAKHGGVDYLIMGNATDAHYAVFNVLTGVVQVASTGATITGATIEALPSDWYRCSVIITKTGTYTQLIGPSNATGATDGSFLGNGTDGVFLWGAQIEANIKPTSYIKTVASTVTRTIDKFSQTGISSLIGQSEGSIAIGFLGKDFGATRILCDIWEDSDNYIRIGITSSFQVTASIVAGGVTQASFTSSAISPSTKYGVVLSYSAGATLMSVNGAQVGSTDTSATIPLTSKANLGLNLNDLASANVNFLVLSLTPTALSIATANALSLSISNL